MLFKKIKYNNGKVQIEYSVKNSLGKTDEYKIVSTDEPKESFKLAFEFLIPSIIEICEFEAGYNKGLIPISVSLSDTDGIMGATITALKTLKTSNAPLVINTPHLPEYDYSGNNPDAPVLPEEAINAIERLKIEAEEFIKGKRKQESLFDEVEIEITNTE